MDRPPVLDNAALAGHLEEMAALLELAGASPYSSRAYRRAGELIRAAPVPVEPLVRQGRARELRGVGRGIEAKLRELVETGEIAELTELRRTTPLELVALGRLLGVGAQRMVEIAAALGGHAAGDARRWVDEPAELAVVVASLDAAAVRERFAALPEIVALLDDATGVTADGIPIGLVVAPPEGLGTALVQATGPAEHLAALGALPVAADEAGVYAALGLDVPPPEIRDGTLERHSPGLVGLDDLRGDVHVHTDWSDGRATVLEMGIAARARGYEYLAICDHTPSVTVVRGLDGDALRRQGEEIADANERLAPFRILRGVECDIRDDGSLDAPDDVLAELDWVQLSLHRGQRTPRRELTARVTEAMRHPAVRSLSHPTGRLIGYRPPNALDLERTIEVALETGVALEVNGLPNRLDLCGEHVRSAIAAGVPITCASDAHSAQGLAAVQYAVHTARRGRATAADVVNARPLADLLARRQRAPR